MTFTVRVQNASPDPILLPAFDDETWWRHVRLEGLDGQGAFLGGAGFHVDFASSPDRTLAAGETWTGTAVMNDARRRFLRIVPDRKPGDEWDYRRSLPPGRYRATLSYAGRAGAAPAGAPRFAGQVHARPVDLTVR
jgi:hypothetical protein